MAGAVRAGSGAVAKRLKESAIPNKGRSFMVIELYVLKTPTRGGGAAFSKISGSEHSVLA